MNMDDIAHKYGSKICKECNKMLQMDKYTFREKERGRVYDNTCKSCYRRKAKLRRRDERGWAKGPLRHTGPTGLERLVFCKWKPTKPEREKRYVRA